VLGEKLLNFVVARRFQTRGQLVIGQVRFQRVVAQGAGMALVRPLVAFGQGGLGLIVILALLGERGCMHRRGAEGGYQDAGQQVEQITAHDTSRLETLDYASLVLCRGGVKAGRRLSCD
jgi:hypothetical protein